MQVFVAFVVTLPSSISSPLPQWSSEKVNNNLERINVTNKENTHMQRKARVPYLFQMGHVFYEGSTLYFWFLLKWNGPIWMALFCSLRKERNLKFSNPKTSTNFENSIFVANYPLPFLHKKSVEVQRSIVDRLPIKLFYI